MIRAEVAENYRIAEDVLVRYEEGVFTEETASDRPGKTNQKLAEANKNEPYQYQQEDLDRLSRIVMLLDSGFTDEEVKEYMRLHQRSDGVAACRMLLNRKREQTLDEIHRQENVWKILIFCVTKMKNRDRKTDRKEEQKNEFV